VEWSSEPQNAIEQGSTPSATKLHLGCGNHKIPGYTNCDLYETSATDHVFDCQGPWPFPDNSVATIYCSHMLEHLPNFKAFFMEAHRVLRPDGNLQIRVPYGGHKAAYWDIEHVRPWFLETFCFLQPGYAQSIGNHQHDGWKHYFGVEDAVLRITDRMTPLLRWTLLRTLILQWLDLLPNAVEELWVLLAPLKTEEQIQGWLALHAGNALPSRYSVYTHHFEQRALGANEVPTFMNWQKEIVWNGFHHYGRRRR
jgi:SAM-dependent methyltransferase